jgi:hypothetical protein
MTDSAASTPTPTHHRFGQRSRHHHVILLLILAFLGFAGVLEPAATTGPLGYVQDSTRQYLDRSEKKAVEAFAVARTINAVVSVLKSADLGVVVAKFAPLEALEPVDDLAKQFSDVMLISIVSILVQKLILSVAQAWALGIVLPVGCLVLAFAIQSRRFASLGRAIIIVALFARFAIPTAALVGERITERFLAQDLDATLVGLQQSSGDLGQAIGTPDSPPVARNDAPAPDAAPDAPTPPSVLDQVRSAVKSTADSTQSLLDRGAARMRGLLPDIGTIKAVALHLPDQIVRAIEIFLVQTLLVPLSVAFLLYGALRRLGGRG